MAEARTQGTPPKRWFKRKKREAPQRFKWTRRLLKLVFGVVFFVVVAVTTVLYTPIGTDAALRVTLPLLEGLFPGVIKYESAEGSVGGELILRGVRIVNPENETAVYVGRLTLSIDLTELVSQKVHIDRIHLEDVEYTLYDSTGGVGIARAFASSKPADANAPPSAWTIQIDNIVVENVRISETADGPVWIPTGALSLGFRLDPDGLHWSDLVAELALGQLPGGPFPWSEASLKSSGDFTNDGVLDVAEFELIAGETHLAALGRVDLQADPVAGSAQIHSKNIELSEIAEIAGVELTGRLALSLNVQSADGHSRAELNVNDGPVAVGLVAQAHEFGGRFDYRVSLTGNGLDVDRYYPALGYPIAMDLGVEAHGHDNPMEAGNAVADVVLSNIVRPDVPIQRMAVSAELTQGEARLNLTAVAGSGGRVVVEALSPKLDADPLVVAADIDVENLEAGPWRELAGVESLEGTVAALSARASATIPAEGAMTISADVTLRADSVTTPVLGLESGRVDRLDLAASLDWDGKGMPVGTVNIRANRPRTEWAKTHELAVDVLAQRSGEAVAMTADVFVHETSLSGDVEVDGVHVGLRGTATSGYEPNSITVDLVSHGIVAGDVRVDEVVADLFAVRQVDGFAATGPITVKKVTVGDTIAIESTDLVAEVTLPDDGPIQSNGNLTLREFSMAPGARIRRALGSWDLDYEKDLPTGRVTLGVDDVRYAGQRFDRVDVRVSLADLTRGGVEVTVRKGKLEATTNLRVRMPDGPEGALIATVEELEASRGSEGLMVRPGAVIRYNPTGLLEVSNLALRRAGQRIDEITLSGSYLLSTQRFDTDMEVVGINLESWLGTIRELSPYPILENTRIAGLLSATVALRGTPARPLGTVKLDLAGARFDDISRISANGDVTLAAGRVEGKLTAKWGGRTTVDLVAALAHDRGRLSKARESSILATLKGLDLDQIPGLVPSVQMSGAVTGQVDLSGPANKLVGKVELSVAGFQMDPVKKTDVSFKARLLSENVAIRLRSGPIDNPVVDLCLSAPMPVLNALVAGKSIDNVVNTTPLSGQLNVRKTRLGDIIDMESLADVLDAEIEMHLGIDGLATKLDIVGRVQADNLPLGDHDADVGLLLTSGGGNTGITLTGRVDGRPLIFLSGTLPGLPGELMLDPDYQRLLRDKTTSVDLRTTAIDANVMEYLLPGATKLLSDVAKVPLISATINLKGAPNGPTISVGGTLKDAAGAEAAFAKEIYVSAWMDHATVRGKVRLMQPQEDGQLHIDGQLPFGTALLLGDTPADFRSLKVDATIRSEKLYTDRLNRSLPGVFGPSPGTLKLDAAITGTVGNPSVEGRLEAAFKTLILPGIGLVQDDVKLAVNFDRENIVLEPLHVEREGASMDLEANLVLDSLELEGIRLGGKMVVDHYPVLNTRFLDATLTGRINLGGTLAVPTFKGLMTTNSLVVRPESGRDLQRLGPPNDVVFTDAEDVGLFEARNSSQLLAAGKAFDVDVAIEIPRRAARVKNDMLDVWAEGQVTAKSTESGLTLLGRVVVVEGTVTVYGKTFNLEDGSQIIFQGGSDIDPALNITARYNLIGIDLGSVGLETDASSHILLTVTGTASEPAIAFSSTPGLSQTNILSVLTVGSAVAGGSADEGSDVDETQRVGSLLLGIVTSQAARMIQERLPVDVFSLETGSADFSDARITVGKRILPNLILSYGANFGADDDENVNEVRLRYEITRSLHLDSAFGDAGAGNLDLVWRWQL